MATIEIKARLKDFSCFFYRNHVMGERFERNSPYNGHGAIIDKRAGKMATSD